MLKTEGHGTLLAKTGEKTPNQRPALRISHQESATTNQRPHNQNQRPHFTDQRPHRRVSDHESTTTTQRLHASH